MKRRLQFKEDFPTSLKDEELVRDQSQEDGTDNVQPEAEYLTAGYVHIPSACMLILETIEFVDDHRFGIRRPYRRHAV